jgi:hypothetical protein
MKTWLETWEVFRMPEQVQVSEMQAHQDSKNSVELTQVLTQILLWPLESPWKRKEQDKFSHQQINQQPSKSNNNQLQTNKWLMQMTKEMMRKQFLNKPDYCHYNRNNNKTKQLKSTNNNNNRLNSVS